MADLVHRNLLGAAVIVTSLLKLIIKKKPKQLKNADEPEPKPKRSRS